MRPLTQIMTSLALLTIIGCRTCPKPDSEEADTACEDCDTADTAPPCFPESAPLWYLDTDGDGWGRDGGLTTQRACEQPEGYAETDGDCDDWNADTYPGAPDSRGDGVDSDCDGVDG